MKVSAILAAAAVLANVAPSVMAAPFQSSAHAELAFKRDYAELLERHPQVLSQLIETASARGFSAEDAELIAREPIFGLFKTGFKVVKGLFGGRRRELGEDYLEARDLLSFGDSYDSAARRDLADSTVYSEYLARGLSPEDAAALIAREPIFGIFKAGARMVKGLFGGRRRELGDDYLEARDFISEEYDSRDFEDVYEYSARAAPSWDELD